MFRFARESVKAHPEAPQLGYLLFDAHAEFASWHTRNPKAYLASKAVRDELEQSFATMVAKAPKAAGPHVCHAVYAREIGERELTLELLHKAAEMGSIQAQLMLGRSYREGIDGKVDSAEAEKWLSKAAESGHRTAQALYGFVLQDKDDAKAVELYKLSAELEDEIGLYNLACAIWSGRGGLERDDAKIVELFTRSAELGFVNAMRELGIVYRNGMRDGTGKTAVEPDLTESTRWLRAAARGRDARARQLLGGSGVGSRVASP